MLPMHHYSLFPVPVHSCYGCHYSDVIDIKNAVFNLLKNMVVFNVLREKTFLSKKNPEIQLGSDVPAQLL